MKKLMGQLIRLLLLSYIGLCLALYFMQGRLLFPSHYPPQMPENWQPTVGVAHAQAFLDGRCGKLHAVIWETAKAKGTVMVFHGNGENIASVEHQVPEFQQLGYSVMAWDYPGYGLSTACRFSEDDLLADAETAYRWLEQGHPALPIVLYGRSVGTALALHVAKQHPHHRVLLVSPYDSLQAVVKEHLPGFIPVALLLRYPLHADEWIGRVQGQVYAIHGTDDTLITPPRAQTLIQKSAGKAEIEWVRGAGHNDIGHFPQMRQWLERHLSYP